jgi:hypothetical protein
LTSLLETYDKEHRYRIYCVYDETDQIYGRQQLSSEYPFDILFISSKGIENSHLTEMWNKAFILAYKDNCDYFYQCGDDTQLLQSHWVNECIEVLQKNNNIGMTGPIDERRYNSGKNSQPGGKRFLMTQSFVSRKHYEIFKFYFPKEIKNWYCDDFITNLYYPKYYYRIDKFMRNNGGPPRYKVVGNLEKNCPVYITCQNLVQNYKKKLNLHLLTNH